MKSWCAAPGSRHHRRSGAYTRRWTRVSRRMRASSSDTAKMLQNIPGVHANGAGGVSSLPTVHGLADDRLRIKVDGMDLIASCPNHMNPALSYLDPGTGRYAAGLRRHRAGQRRRRQHRRDDRGRYRGAAVRRTRRRAICCRARSARSTAATATRDRATWPRPGPARTSRCLYRRDLEVGQLRGRRTHSRPPTRPAAPAIRSISTRSAPRPGKRATTP